MRQGDSEGGGAGVGIGADARGIRLWRWRRCFYRGTGRHVRRCGHLQRWRQRVGPGPGLSLQLLNNGGDAVTVGGNGGFRFPGKLSAGATYAATVGTRPSGQQCTIDKGSGTVANADVADIAVTCSARPLFAYVANADDNTVQAFALDPATGAATGVGRPAAVGHGPVSLVADPAGTTLYVVNASDNTVTTLAIHPDTGAVSVSAPAVRTGASPLSIARTPAGPFAYTANAGDNTLSIFKMSAKAEAPARAVSCRRAPTRTPLLSTARARSPMW